jgi:hypothetical protein
MVQAPPLPSPLAPFLSHAAGEALTFPLAPFLSHAAGAEGGEMSGAGAILRLATIPRLRTRSPLSRRAGEGPGVRAALTFPPGPLPLPRCGRGPHLPPSPLPLPRCGSGRGRDERSRGDPAAGNDTAFAHQIPPLPQGGRGAGGEAGPHLPPQPPSSPTLRERKGER